METESNIRALISALMAGSLYFRDAATTRAVADRDGTGEARGELTLSPGFSCSGG
ncbi:hypothetical protein GCM10009672_11200 [Nesterenkonia lutea]